ncbi:MAG: hypothetical protein ACOYN0_03555 [Phycisphaerales bacterium]
MSQSRVLVLLAGAALSIGAPALAQNAKLDSDRAYAAELMNDSATRSSLLQGGGGSAGHDAGGFSIGDGSGNNQLYLGGAMQFRYQHSFRDKDAVGDQNDFTHGFSNENVRFWTYGHVWSKDLTYKIQFHHEAEGGWELEDAFGMYAFDNGLAVKWGQFKAPVFREENIDSEKQLAIGRSNSNEIFSQGYSQAVALQYASDAFRVVGAFGDGASTANTDFDSGSEADYALTARFDFKIAGSDWDRFLDFTSFRSQDNAGLVGGAIHWQDGGETGGTVDASLLAYTVDFSWEGPGWNVYVAGMGLTQEDNTSNTDSDDFGLLAQGGIFVSDQVELFARWDAIFWDSDRTDLNGDAIDDNHFLAAGVNYYISPESHAVKFTGQVSWALNATPFADTGEVDANGDPILASVFNNNSILGQSEDNEITLGFQMQVMF